MCCTVVVNAKKNVDFLVFPSGGSLADDGPVIEVRMFGFQSVTAQSMYTF